MIDHITIARSYIDLWNERAQHRRSELLNENWTADASYVDPLMKGDGRDGIDALIAGLSRLQIHIDGRAQRLRRPYPLQLGSRSRRRRQPDQGN